eukprot:PhF_6_TR7553/c0_g1_i1/m.11151
MRSSSVRSNTNSRNRSPVSGVQPVYQQARSSSASKNGQPIAIPMQSHHEGGYPRAQSLAGDYIHNTTTNHQVVGPYGAPSPNNSNKLKHLLRFVNHKSAENRFDLPTENFFTGSKLVRELAGVTAKCMACVGDSVWIGEKSG